MTLVFVSLLSGPAALAVVRVMRVALVVRLTSWAVVPAAFGLSGALAARHWAPCVVGLVAALLDLEEVRVRRGEHAMGSSALGRHLLNRRTVEP